MNTQKDYARNRARRDDQISVRLPRHTNDELKSIMKSTLAVHGRRVSQQVLIGGVVDFLCKVHPLLDITPDDTSDTISAKLRTLVKSR